MSEVNDLSKQILESKYYSEGENSPDELFMRVAKVSAIPDVIDRLIDLNHLFHKDSHNIFEPYQEVARRVLKRRNIMINPADDYVEISLEDIEVIWEDEAHKYFHAMSNLEFMPGTPTLINAGRPTGMLSSCFFLRVPDSMEGIMETNKQLALISKAGGGVGLDVSALRPCGAAVATSAKGRSSGPVSFLKVFNETGNQVQQGGVRRAALIAIMSIDHPDIVEFIKCKEEEGTLSNFNISVLVTDDFMRALEKDPEGIWACKWKNKTFIIDKESDTHIEVSESNTPSDTDTFYRVKDIWNIIVSKAWSNGEPGIIFWDELNRGDVFKGKFGKLGVNPCVPATTWIMTCEGPKQVGDLLADQFSAQVDGTEFSASKFFETGNKPLVKITTREGFEVCTTPNHLFKRVIGVRHVRDPNNYNGTRLTDYLEDWVPAGELNPGDIVRLHNHKYSNKWNGPGTWSEGYLLGILIGDGYLTNDNLGKIEIWDDDGSKEMIAKVLEFVEPLNKRSDFKGFHYTEKTKKHTLTLAELYKLAKSYDVVQGNKHITPKIEKTSYDFHIGFLRGFFDADGSVQGTQEKGISIRLAQSHFQDLQAVQRMLLRIGIHSKIYKRREAGTHELPDSNGKPKEYHIKDQFELMISGNGLHKYTRDIGFCHTKKREDLLEKLENYKRKFNKMKFTATVDTIELLPAEKVYDTTVIKVHVFDGNGFYLHNCGEQPLLPFESCNLAAINLGKCWYTDKDDIVKIDYEKINELTALGIRFLDNVIDINRFPLPEIEEWTLKTRRVGLGTMGLHDLMLRKKIRYGSNESLALIDKVYSTIQKRAQAESTELGNKRGIPKDVKSLKRRNSGLLTIQPTGTVSIICNQTSSGVEPVFQWEFTRKDSYGTHKIQHFIMEEFPEKLPEYAVTALEITPSEHVKIQAQIQKYIDSSISKCLAKGTLIPTNKGVIPIEKLGYATDPNMFGPPMDNLEVYSEDKQWHKVKSFYFGGIKDTIKITLSNGVVIEGTENHKIMTIDGWKSLRELIIDDYVLSLQININKTKGSQPLPTLEQLKTNANMISTPTHMSKDLALFLGMLVADGTTTEATGFTGLFEKNKKVGKLFDDLSQKLFDQIPKIYIDKRTEVRTHFITSRALCRWIELLIGKGSDNKHIPSEILCGSEEEILEFVRGVTLDGYNAQNELVIYDGKSERLARELCALMHQLGRAPYLGKKYVKSHDYYVYNVRICNFNGIEPHKLSELHDKDRLIKVPEEWHSGNYLNIDSNHPNYSTMRNIWQNKQKVAKQSTFAAFGQNYPKDEYYVKVTGIEKAQAPVYDLEIENVHSYVVNGLVSHNTVNLPNTATREQVDHIFRLAHKTKCKSITIYRSGSRQTEVLMKESESQEESEDDSIATNVPQATSPRLRGPVLFGATFKINTPGGKSYMTINEDDHGIREVFIHISKAGSEITTHVEAEGRLISHALKHNIPADTIIGHLAGHKSNPIFDSGRSVRSVPDAVAIVMQQYKDHYEGFSEYIDKEPTKAVDNKPQLSGEISGELCPDCGEVMYQAGGCNHCYCGYSQCG